MTTRIEQDIAAVAKRIEREYGILFPIQQRTGGSGARKVLFQLPAQLPDMLSQIGEIKRASYNFNEWYGKKEGITLTTEAYDSSKIADNYDALVIFADRSYLPSDMKVSLDLIVNKGMSKKGVMLFCYTDECQYSDGRFPSNISLEAYQPIANIVGFCEMHVRFDLAKLLEQAERGYPSRIQVIGYPQVCTDPEYYFSGFRSVAQAFMNEMGSEPRRRAFLNYGTLHAGDAYWLR